MAKRKRHVNRGLSRPAELESKWQEVGTLGLQSFSGFVQAAHATELRWPACYALYNRIRRSDPEISIVRSGYASLARRVEIEVVGPETPNADDTAAAEFYESELDNVDGGFSRFLETLVSYTPFMGWAWWEVVPGLRDPEWRPPDGDPWRSTADDGLVGVRRLAWRDHSSFESWDLDDATGRLNGLKQNDFPNPPVTIPLERSLHIVFGDATSPEGLTPLEGIYRLERIKFGLEVVNGIGFEHAAGYLNVNVDKSTLTADDKSNIQAAARSILTAQEGNYAVWPGGITGEVKDINFQAAPALLEAIRYYGLLKLQLYQMQWAAIASTAGTGAYSAMADASSMFLTYWNAMLSGFIDQYDQQVGRRLWEWNKDRFPGAQERPRYQAKQITKIVDLGEMGTFLSAINKIMPLGEQDFIAIRKNAGFLPETLPEPDELPQMQPDQAGEDQAEQDVGDQEEGRTDGADDREAEKELETRRAVFALAQELRALRD